MSDPAGCRANVVLVPPAHLRSSAAAVYLSVVHRSPRSGVSPDAPLPRRI